MNQESPSGSTIASRLVTAFFCLLLFGPLSAILISELVSTPLTSIFLVPDRAIAYSLLAVMAYASGTLMIKLLLNRPPKTFFGPAFKVGLPAAGSLLFLSTLASALMSGSIKKMTRGAGLPDVVYSLSSDPVSFAVNCLFLLSVSASLAGVAFVGYRSLTLRSTGDAVQAGSSSK